MTVGQRLKKWRDSTTSKKTGKTLTQREAADLAGVSQAAWQAVESGSIKRLGLEVADKIVQATGGTITLDDLLGRRRPRPSSPPRAA